MAQFALATIFLLAAGSKLQDPRPPSALRVLGAVSEGALLSATRAIAVGEVVLAAMLVSPYAPVAAVIALAFLVLTGGLVLFKDAGNAPDCGCFGSQLQVHDRQMRALRHLGFVALAVVTLATPGTPNAFDALSGMSVGVAFVLFWPLLGSAAIRSEVRS